MYDQDPVIQEKMDQKFMLLCFVKTQISNDLEWNLIRILKKY
jgi:hypothetical protein